MEQIEAKSKTFGMPLIFLTGCINPSGMAFTTLQDQKVRKQQYCDSIQFYLENTSSRILFVENSGVDISDQFKGTSSARLEIITFNGNTYDKSFGKGYGEMLIIDYAIKNSSFIKQSPKICKITGRYKILNINSLIKAYSSYGRDIMVNLLFKRTYSDSRIFIGDVNFFNKYLLKYAKEVNDTKGYFFEHALCNAVLDAMKENYFLLPFKYFPRISGQSGTDNLFYKSSLMHWMPRNILQLIKFYASFDVKLRQRSL